MRQRLFPLVSPLAVAFASAALVTVACVGSDSSPPGPSGGDEAGASSGAPSSSGQPSSSTSSSSGSTSSTSSSASSSSGAAGKLAFVTSGTFSGDSFHGIDGADVACAAAASAGSMTAGRTFKAWIADKSGSAPITRFTTKSTTGYMTTGGRPIVSSWSNLVSGSMALEAPIDHDENGAAVGASETRVWTNVSVEGGAQGVGGNTDCDGWNDPGQSATVGDATKTDTQWTVLASGTIGCSAAVHLYCFEQ